MEETYSLRSLPGDMKRILFNESKRKIFGPQLKRHAMEVCRNKISETYINNAIKQFTHGYLYMKGNEILGFALWEVHIINRESVTTNRPNLESYIDVRLVCSKNKENKLGSIISSDIERYCIKHHIYSIIMEPADSNLEKIYNSIGYKKGKIPLTPYLFENQMTKLVSQSTLSKTRKVLKTKNNLTRSRYRDDPIDYENSSPLEMVYNNDLL